MLITPFSLLACTRDTCSTCHEYIPSHSSWKITRDKSRVITSSSTLLLDTVVILHNGVVHDSSFSTEAGSVLHHVYSQSLKHLFAQGLSQDICNHTLRWLPLQANMSVLDLFLNPVKPDRHMFSPLRWAGFPADCDSALTIINNWHLVLHRDDT